MNFKKYVSNAKKSLNFNILLLNRKNNNIINEHR